MSIDNLNKIFIMRNPDFVQLDEKIFLKKH
nr:MAG TPA: hypothetical protein [Caudoviricetes sp.]